MGGGGTRNITTTQSQAPVPQVLPQLAPYTQTMGNYAQALLNTPGTTPLRFANDQPIPVPDLTPLQQQAIGQVQQRTASGLPVPVAEIANEQNLLNLPGQMGQQVPMSPYTTGSVGTGAMGAAATTPGFNPVQNAGINTLSQFAGQGGFNQTSPAIQSAIQNVQNTIQPQIENTLATQGLARSPEVLRQLSNAYAGQLVPLYMQGLQQSQQAGTTLGQLGAGQTAQQLQGLQGLQQAQQAAGQSDQALQTEALSRQMYSTLSGAPNLYQIGLRQEQRPVDQIQQAMSAGQTQRDVQLQQQQAALDSYNRAREISLGLMNPLGSFGAVSYTPSSSQSSQTSPQGFGLGKT